MNGYIRIDVVLDLCCINAIHIYIYWCASNMIIIGRHDDEWNIIELYINRNKRSKKKKNTKKYVYPFSHLPEPINYVIYVFVCVCVVPPRLAKLLKVCECNQITPACRCRVFFVLSVRWWLKCNFHIVNCSPTSIHTSRNTLRPPFNFTTTTENQTKIERKKLWNKKFQLKPNAFNHCQLFSHKYI